MTEDGSTAPSFTTAAAASMVKPPGEDGQVAQQMLLCLGQQFIAPIEYAAQGPMPRQCRAASTCQQRETIVQAGGHLL